GLTFASDGNLYVADAFNNSVKRYNGTSGAYISDFVASGSGGLGSPAGLAFGPDGHLYVSSASDSSVKRYNGATGAFVDNFVTAGSGGLNGPSYLTFTPALPFIQQVAVVCTKTDVVDSQIGCIHYRTNAYTAVDICGQSNYCQ